MKIYFGDKALDAELALVNEDKKLFIIEGDCPIMGSIPELIKEKFPEFDTKSYDISKTYLIEENGEYIDYL